MTLSLDPKQLAAMHAALKSIPDRGTKIPVAGMFHLAKVEGGIAMTATDMDIETTVTLDVAGDFAPVCLPPYLIETGGKLAGDKVEILLDERTAIVKAGRSRFTAPVLPGADFPRLRPAFDTRIEIAGEALARLIEATVDAAAQPGDQDPRFYLEGVFLQTAMIDGEPRLAAVATNGHRLHTVSIPVPEGVTLGSGIIVPTKAAGEIARIAGKAGGSKVGLDCGASAVAIEAGGERLTSKLIEASYPDWQRVIPAPTGVTATFDLADMVAALDRVVKVMEASKTGKPAEKNRSGTGVRIAADGEWLTITASGPHSAADATDAIRAEFAGEWGMHGVSSRYLLATLSNMRERGAETVVVDSNEIAAPLRIESVTDEEFLAIVMPMRVSA